MSGNGTRPTILIGATDPGAANALAPVVERLQRDARVHAVCVCPPLAAQTFAAFGVSTIREDGAGAETLVRSLAPRLILIGTSEEQGSIDRRLLRQARKQGIPVVCLLDYWSRYAERFSGAASGERLAYVPDLIFVMDEAARDGMVAEGISADRLVVTGHPYLERYHERIPRLSAAARQAFLAGLGISPEQQLITFVSETFGWTYDASYRFPPLSDSRERTVIILEHVLAALTDLAPDLAPPIVLLNKLHPKNRVEEFQWLEQARWPFPVRSVTALPNATLLQASSLVVGLTSMLLVEAACLGVPTLSVVPRAVEERIGSHAGPAWPMARTPQDLRALLKRVLGSRAERPSTDVSDAIETRHLGATDRVVRRLYGLVEG